MGIGHHRDTRLDRKGIRQARCPSETPDTDEAHPAQSASPWSPAYDLAYTYDAGGNRLTKHDALNNVTTVYHYDIEDQETYGTRNNRLMWYAVSQNGEEIEKVYYAYHAGGHADQIIRKAAGDATYYRTYFLYDKQGRTWMAVRDQWQLDGQTGEPVNAERTWAREFRHGGSGRQRYLTRARDPQTLLPASAADGLWSEYDGEGVYCDYGVDVGVGTAEGATLMQYEPGVWQRDAADPQTPLDYYFHGDLIGSTRAISDGEGSAVQRVIYTAFGERVWSDGSVGTRYGYAGAWGYEGGGVWGDENELPYLHVGERLYNPATGRFLQRDPIGIRGGSNVYEYVGSSPARLIDPSGLDYIDDIQNVGAVIAGCGAVLLLIPGTSGAGTVVGAGGVIIIGIGSGLRLIEDHPGMGKAIDDAFHDPIHDSGPYDKRARFIGKF
ncbi:MAG: RHS repeat-associated core domain-containing protein [Phycisphaerae bacterium]|nr:RHS repeat-associated core domain-containing protein [Phycisphaerae bacterium]